MSRELFDFLTESVFWDDQSRVSGFADLDDDELLRKLEEFRAHAMRVPVATSSDALALCIGAADEQMPDDVLLKRAVAYFDHIVVPDPLFRVSQVSLSRKSKPWSVGEPLPRQEVAAACEYLKHLTPLVRTGHVRIAPTPVAFESPAEIPVTYSESLYAERVPEALRAWFSEKARLRKVIVDRDGRRLVLRAPPDAQTCTVQVDFGQLGPVNGFDYMNLLETDGDGRFKAVTACPPDPEHLSRWLEQSVNQSAGDFLTRVLRDASIAEQLGCFYMTSCETTAELLGLQGPVGGGSAFAASAALTLELPALEAASLAQLAELLERAPEAFAAFQIEVRDGLAGLSDEMDHEELRSTISAIQTRLARDQVRAVESEIRKAKNDLRWDIPIAIGRVTLGVVASLHGAFPLAISLLHGGIEGLQTLRKTAAHRVLPGYFLWRLNEQ